MLGTSIPVRPSEGSQSRTPNLPATATAHRFSEGPRGLQLVSQANTPEKEARSLQPLPGFLKQELAKDGWQVRVRRLGVCDRDPTWPLTSSVC